VQLAGYFSQINYSLSYIKRENFLQNQCWFVSEFRAARHQAKLAHGVVTPGRGQKRRHSAAVPEDFSPIAKNTGAIF